MTNIFTNKILEMFRNLKSDAVPRPPRPENTETNEEIPEVDENSEFIYDQEESVFNTNFTKNEDNKPKPDGKKPKSNKKKDPKPEKVNRQDSSSSNVQTQATGNVINILNSKGVRMGNDITIYNGGYEKSKQKQGTVPEEHIEKCNLITLLMEAEIKPDHEYIDYISKNLGRNWHSFFRRLGYTKGRIETVEIDEAKNGVSEARYKLLLDWIRNEDGTLGHLASQLWEEDERQVVKELAIIYDKNKK